MKKSMSVFLVIVSVIVVLSMAAAVCLSTLTYLKVSAMESESEEIIPEGSVTGEDNVVIGGEYVIRSTTAISDAYISGDSSALSEKDQETLQMASDVLAEVITDGMSDYEKEEAVFMWIHDNIGGDSQVNVLVRDDVTTDNPHGVLSGRNAVCVGYATTFRLFMQMLEIPCKVVHDSSCVHSWDLVQLGGSWYHTDCYSAQSESEPRYFLNRNDEMMQDGYGWDTTYYPAADSIEQCYVYKNAEKADSVFDIPAKVRAAVDAEENLVSLVIGGGEDELNIAERLLSDLESRLMSSVEYGNCYIRHMKSTVDDDHIFVCVLIENYSYDDGDYTDDISDEDMQKITDALDESFGDLTVNDYYGGFDGDVACYYSNGEY